MRRSVLKIYFASTACLFESAAGRPKRATHSASLPAQRQLHRNCKTLQQPILWALFPNTAFSTTLLSNTSLQHLCTKLLCNSLLQHASPTLFSSSFLHHFSPNFSTMLLYNSLVQDLSPTVRLVELGNWGSFGLLPCHACKAGMCCATLLLKRTKLHQITHPLRQR